ncbi:methyltransferase family protein [Chryseobacterium sp. c4a]|uniref:methyltransferase family protein n=1 Tax=Chryseobacterium sp. c4a TaxID=1573582 RepID=UPI001359B1FD|nr:isoprenylcysteine carboxylmethyltransferase family protein [Chryseobacterium sp. c4a]
MKTFDVIIYFGVIFWFVMEYYNIRTRLSSDGDKKMSDKIGVSNLWMIFCISLIGSVIIAELIDCPISSNISFRYLGLFLFVCGFILRVSAIRNLGKFFTMDLSIRKDHQLITTGVYKFIRHPSYTGIIIGLAGIGLTLNNWISLCFGTILFFMAFNKRISNEERGLVNCFGDEYIQYQKKTKRWIPFIY